jgi:uncharacterized protein YndB with AHSA1/START domain
MLPSTMSETVTVSAVVNAPLETAWNAWTTPEHITQWNFASPDWACPTATNDVRPGGAFSWRMEAKDGSMGFDFGGTYTDVVPHERLEYALGDERTVQVQFERVGENQTRVTESFTAESQNPVEMQRAGWQAILDNYKRHTESL